LNAEVCPAGGLSEVRKFKTEVRKLKENEFQEI
jgi:hypothetical protein